MACRRARRRRGWRPIGGRPPRSSPISFVGVAARLRC
jgi:hypothetical protein